MVDSILRVFDTGVTYKVHDMPSHTKVTITNPPKVNDITLDKLVDMGCEVQINVKEQRLHIDLQKQRKRKRQDDPQKYTGSLQKTYKVGRGEHILRYILSVPDLCDFGVEEETVDDATRLVCNNVECVPYSVVKHGCKNATVVCNFPRHRLEFTLHGMD